MKVYQETVSAEDGLALNYYRWLPEKAHSAIVISHGWSEHAGRYDSVAKWFAGKGYEVHALDHRGQGKSQGQRGHVDCWSHYVKDLEQLRQNIDLEAQYLLGHSMGGMISILHLLEYPERFKAVALSGPAADVSMAVPKLKYLVSKALNKLWPSMSLSNSIDPYTVCSDKKVVDDYIKDPLNHGNVSVRWFMEYLGVIDRVKAEANSIKTPVAIWHGDGDALVEPWVSEQFFERLSHDQKQREEIPEALHEILYEPNWQDTADKMRSWYERFQ